MFLAVSRFLVTHGERVGSQVQDKLTFTTLTRTNTRSTSNAGDLLNSQQLIDMQSTQIHTITRTKVQYIQTQNVN